MIELRRAMISIPRKSYMYDSVCALLKVAVDCQTGVVLPLAGCNYVVVDKYVCGEDRIDLYTEVAVTDAGDNRNAAVTNAGDDRNAAVQANDVPDDDTIFTITIMDNPAPDGGEF